jgi:hypothetical protein
MENKDNFGLAPVKNEGKIPFTYDEQGNKIYIDLWTYLPLSDEWQNKIKTEDKYKENR